MSLTIRWPALPVHPTDPRRKGRVAAALRHAARAALVGAKQVGRAAFVLAIVAVMLATAMALGLLIWVPHIHVDS